jgi:hypothetical protein
VNTKKQIKKGSPPKKRRAPAAAKRKRAAPKTAAQYLAESQEIRDRWNRVVGVVTKMRNDKVSLQKAAREIGISPRTVARMSGKALQKGPNGRYSAKASDRLLRVLKIPTDSGTSEIGVRGSRKATQLSKYWEAVHVYLATGDDSSLRKFRGKYITDADGTKTPFLTDLDELDRLGSAGVLSFESLYARST